MERNEFHHTEELETELMALPGLHGPLLHKSPPFPGKIRDMKGMSLTFMTLSPGFLFWRLTAISHNLLYRGPFDNTALFQTAPILETAGA